MTSEATVPEAAVIATAFAMWSATTPFLGKTLAEFEAMAEHVAISDLGEGVTLEQDFLLDWQMNRDTFMVMARQGLAAALPHLSTAIHDAAGDAVPTDALRSWLWTEIDRLMSQAEHWAENDKPLAVNFRLQKTDAYFQIICALNRKDTRDEIWCAPDHDQPANYPPSEAIYRYRDAEYAVAALKGKSIPAPAEGNEAEAPAPAQAPGELVRRLRHFRNTLLVNASREETSDWCRQTLTDAIAALQQESPSEEVLVKALERIERWFGEFPETGKVWPDGSPISYAAQWGSNGERDFMREIARTALAARRVRPSPSNSGDTP